MWFKVLFSFSCRITSSLSYLFTFIDTFRCIFHLKTKWLFFFQSDQPKGVFRCAFITQVYPHINQDKNPNLFYIDTVERRYAAEAPNINAMKVWLGCFNSILWLELLLIWIDFRAKLCDDQLVILIITACWEGFKI